MLEDMSKESSLDFFKEHLSGEAMQYTSRCPVIQNSCSDSLKYQNYGQNFPRGLYFHMT